MAGEGAVNVLLGVGQLQVHVAVDGDQVALVYKFSFSRKGRFSYLVLHAPLELDEDRFTSERIQKGLGVGWGDGHLKILI